MPYLLSNRKALKSLSMALQDYEQGFSHHTTATILYFKSYHSLSNILFHNRNTTMDKNETQAKKLS